MDRRIGATPGAQGSASGTGIGIGIIPSATRLVARAITFPVRGKTKVKNLGRVSARRQKMVAVTQKTPAA